MRKLNSGYAVPDCKLWWISPEVLCDSDGDTADTVVIVEDDGDDNFNWSNH